MRLNWLLNATVLSFATVISPMAEAQSAAGVPAAAQVADNTEYRVAEIFLSSTPETDGQVRANAARIVEQLRGGASFLAYARQFSEATSASLGGELGWVRPDQLPRELRAPIRAMQLGAIEGPIAVPGGYSIITVSDLRRQP